MLKTLTEYARKRYSVKTVYKENDAVKFWKVYTLIGKRKRVLELAGGSPLKNYVSFDNDYTEIGIEVMDFQKDNIPVSDNSFDVVVTTELIEHIFDCDRLLQEVRRVLTPFGRFITSTPNLASLGRRFMLLTGQNPYVENFLYPDDAGHIKHFTFKDYKYLLERNGFLVTKMLSDCIVLPWGFWYKGADLFPHLGRSIIVSCTKF